MIANWMKKIKWLLRLRSLRAHLFLIILAAGIIPSVLMRYGIVENYEERAVEVRTSEVRNQLLIIGNHLIANNYLTSYMSDDPADSSSREIINAELEMLSNLYDGRVMIIGNNLKVVKDTYGISGGKTIVSEEVIRCFQGVNTANYNPEHGYIEVTMPIIDTASVEGSDDKDVTPQIQGVLLASISSANISSTMEILSRKAFILEILMIVAIFCLALVLSFVLTRPLRRVSEAINEVHAGYSDERISVPDYVETVQIVDAFNHMLERTKAQDDSRQEFVANVSHELKTPMTSMKVLAESLLSQEEVPGELYREFMEDIVSEVDRESRIITDLLALVKMDKKVQELNIASTNINDLAELILKRLRPIARKREVELVFESMRPVMAEVDEVKMSLVMTNLVENAIKYNHEHGWVRVLLDADHQYFTFEVSDSGPGIPEEAMPHIFERFYRVDKSHSREIGGTGLGLAITRSAVLMHRGSITVTSKEGEGSSFQVKIPLTYIA